MWMERVSDWAVVGQIWWKGIIPMLYSYAKLQIQPNFSWSKNGYNQYATHQDIPA
jgi:valyl-tRNA synthetase